MVRRFRLEGECAVKTLKGVDTLTGEVARISSGAGSGSKPTMIPDSQCLFSKRLEDAAR